MNRTSPVLAKIGTIFLTWKRYLQRNLISEKITLKQLHVLRQLSRSDYLHPSEIAEMLFADRPTATVIIQNMARENWVRREKDPYNARQTRIILTEAGRQKLASVDASNADSASAAFDPLACFSPAEIHELNRLLHKLENHMEHLK